LKTIFSSISLVALLGALVILPGCGGDEAAPPADVAPAGGAMEGPPVDASEVDGAAADPVMEGEAVEVDIAPATPGE
jgi:hypothetical protein